MEVEREASSESKLKDIEITGIIPSICKRGEEYCKLDSEYNEDKNEYTMTVPAGIRDLEFTALKKHDYQTVEGEGVKRLKGGENRIEIISRSEDGTKESRYTYKIIRDMTGNNYIDTLKIINPETEIGFSYLVTEYSFKVENSVTRLDMEIKLDDENARYTVKGNENFKVGNNIVEIEVEAANKEVRSYILNVYRVSNGNTLLNNLKVKNGETNYTLSPEFKDITTNYTLEVENEIESVIVEGEAQETTTSVTGIGTYELQTGENEVKVITTAENGDIETYRIIIRRKKSTNNYLKS